MLGAIKSPGAITIHPFNVKVDVPSKISDMTKINEEVFLYPTVEISVFTTTPNFLVVGCATCNDNQGWLKFYNPENIRMLKAITGKSKSHEWTGKHV